MHFVCSTNRTNEYSFDDKTSGEKNTICPKIAQPIDFEIHKFSNKNVPKNQVGVGINFL